MEKGCGREQGEGKKSGASGAGNDAAVQGQLQELQRILDGKKARQ